MEELSFTSLRLLLKRLVVWVKCFIRANPGALPILGFQGLMITCAILLIFGMNETADNLVVIAYFMLVVGVLIQLADFVMGSCRERKGD